MRKTPLDILVEVLNTLLRERPDAFHQIFCTELNLGFRPPEELKCSPNGTFTFREMLDMLVRQANANTASLAFFVQSGKIAAVSTIKV